MYHFTGVIQKPVPYLQYVTTPLKVVKQDAVKVQQTINKPIPTLPKGVQSEASGFNGFGISGRCCVTIIDGLESSRNCCDAICKLFQRN